MVLRNDELGLLRPTNRAGELHASVEVFIGAVRALHDTVAHHDSVHSALSVHIHAASNTIRKTATITVVDVHRVVLVVFTNWKKRMAIS